MDINKLCHEVHANALAKGFWDEQLSDQHCLMLVITELSEAVEADRKGKRALKSAYIGEHLDFGFSNELYDTYIKGSVEEEISDAFIRLLDLFGARGISLDEDAFYEGAIEEYAATYQGKSFSELIFYIVSVILDSSETLKYSQVAAEMLLLEILGFSKHLNIDLMWHVEQKMKYNQNRERMHGKKY